MNYYLAIDIGASSGRHILGSLQNGKIVIEEVYRFENGARDCCGTLCWDSEKLFNHVVAGIKECGKLGKQPAALAIDTWGVDYALIDKNGKRLCKTVSYRDNRTKGADKQIEKTLPFSALYQKTGIQKQQFNTIYQLYAHKQQSPADFENAAHFLMMPEYLSFLLTGVIKNEYTNATTTAMVNAVQKEWDLSILKTIDVPQNLFSPLSKPGTVLGGFTDKIKAEIGFDAKVLLAPSHDTASAFLAVPAKDDNAVYLSSGTWSLLGVENKQPITTVESLAANFTNEGGYDYRFRYLKNIMGLWMVQSVRRETADKPSYAVLEEQARNNSSFASIVDANDEVFLNPLSMIKAVQEFCRKTNQSVPQTTGEIMQCVYQSLAASYASAIKTLQMITGKKYTSINIVGGGSKDGYLNLLTAKATGLPVTAGPTEATALGNLLCQFIASGELSNINEARQAISRSFELTEVK